MRVWLFGELRVDVADVPVAVRGIKQRTLLAALALTPGQPVSAERLIGVLWRDAPVAHPGNALQAQIGQLRRTVGTAVVRTTVGAGYALDVAPDDVDVVRFEQGVTSGRRLAADGDAERASRVLGDALALRTAEPLAEFAFAGFADEARARLDELMLTAVEVRAGASLELGRHAELVGDLQAWCRLHPLRERLLELLMIALYRSGRQSEALGVYSKGRARLRDELGVDPGPALQELEMLVLGHDPSLAAATPTTPAPEPPPTGPRGNLRERLTSFVGRGPELKHLRDAVHRSRLVTLIGPGGTGKTRLAIEVAAALDPDLADGAWLVELAGLTEADGVASAVAGALGAAAAAMPAPQLPGSTVELLVRHLAGRSLLVVLDNCEHVIEQAAELVHALLTALPGLRIVATSREPLGVPGEVLQPVDGLPTWAAVELFVDRARTVRAGFTADDESRVLINQICTRLDGSPLAVELAAARLRGLTLAMVAARLDDRFRLLTGGARTSLPRHQTLRAVVDWSYDLLSEGERLLFARLSVFTGGCELDAVEAVCGDEAVPSEEILTVLTRLVDKSLVTIDLRADTARYSQLWTLRHYARERLDAAGETDRFTRRHARWFLSVAEQGRGGLRGHSGFAWRARLGVELDNLRAALDWFIGRGDAASALALMRGIAYFWFVRTDFREGYRWLGDALALDPTGVEGPHGLVGLWQAYFGVPVVGLVASLAQGRAAMAKVRLAGESDVLATALLVFADLLNRHGDLEQSQAALTEAYPLLLAAGEPWGHGAHDVFAARNLAGLGRLDEAERVGRRGVEVLRASGERWTIIYGLGMLAGLQEARGELTSASASYLELVGASRLNSMIHFETMWLTRLGALHARLGDDATARRFFAESAAANPRTPNPAALVGLAAAARRLGDLDQCRRTLDEAERLYAVAGLPAGSTAALIGLTWWALAAGEPDLAAGYADSARDLATRAADPVIAVLADTVAAAVALTASNTTAHRDDFTRALVRRASAGRSAAFLEGTLDEPDVDALAAAHGLTVASVS